MKKWYGCCSNDQCELFKGLTGVKTERIAAKEWNDFAAQVNVAKPIIQSNDEDVQEAEPDGNAC